MTIVVGIVGPEADKWFEPEIPLVVDAIEEILFKHYAEAVRRHTSYHTDYWRRVCITCAKKHLVGVSGGCPKGGVDIIAEGIFDTIGMKKDIKHPETHQWPDEVVRTLAHGKFRKKGYRTRNIEIVDRIPYKHGYLYCIVPHRPNSYCPHCEKYGHIKNGGCWVLKRARREKKHAELKIIQYQVTT